MSEVQAIVRLGKQAQARGEQLCLATVVHVEGSAYRKPGARMLMTSGGSRAGTISGGCLEAEVSRKAWWLTAHGPRVERYSSFADEDGGMPYGLGCGGVVTLLLEQGEAVAAVLGALEQGLADRQSSVVVTALRAQAPGTLAVLRIVGRGPEQVLQQVPKQAPEQILERAYAQDLHDDAFEPALEAAARAAARCQSSHALDESFRPWTTQTADTAVGPGVPAYLIEYLPPAPSVTLFGAGEDAQPIAELAHTLGWRVTVADGRAHLARHERFPSAAEVRVVDYASFAEDGLRAACGVAGAASSTVADPGRWQPPPAGAYDSLTSDDIAILVTHSYEQDRALLLALLPRRMRYLGVLGPRHRTERLLGEVAPALGIAVHDAFARLHSPVGLDLGAGEPAAVALAIVAEIQAVLHGRRVRVERTGAASAEHRADHHAGHNVDRDASQLHVPPPGNDPLLTPASDAIMEPVDLRG